MLSKWVGESNKLTAAIFSLARKLSANGRAVVIFIDEIDAILGDLKSHETEWGVQVRDLWVHCLPWLEVHLGVVTPVHRP